MRKYKNYQDWLYSFLRNLPKVSYLQIRNTILYKNYNDINWYFIYYIILMLGKYIKKIKLSKGEYHLYLKNYNDIEKVLYFLKYNIMCQFKTLIAICGIDFIENLKERFQINYNLLSITYYQRIHIKINVKEFIAVPSSIKIFRNASWYEREVWDMFGIFFKNHNDLRRILTDYGFDGFPLRKDFPQTGYIELRYNYDYKHLVYEPLELSQEYRNFDFLSPWNQIK